MEGTTPEHSSLRY